MFEKRLSRRSAVRKLATGASAGLLLGSVGAASASNHNYTKRYEVDGYNAGPKTHRGAWDSEWDAYVDVYEDGSDYQYTIGAQADLTAPDYDGGDGKYREEVTTTLYYDYYTYDFDRTLEGEAGSVTAVVTDPSEDIQWKHGTLENTYGNAPTGDFRVHAETHVWYGDEYDGWEELTGKTFIDDVDDSFSV